MTWWTEWFLLVTSPTFLLRTARTRAGPETTLATPRIPQTGRREPTGPTRGGGGGGCWGGDPAAAAASRPDSPAGSAKEMSWVTL